MKRGTSRQLLVAVRVAALIIAVGSSAGCVAAVALPLAGIANLAHKSGTMTVVMEGSGDRMSAFRSAAIETGGFITATTNGFSRAEFTDVDVAVDMQTTEAGRMTIRGGSLSNVGRTYEFEDGITDTTQAVVDALTVRGFRIVSSQRDRGV